MPGFHNAFDRGARAGMLSLLADNVVHDVNHGPREVVKPAFAACLQRVSTSYSKQLRDIVVMAARDDHRAAAEFVAHGTFIADDAGMAAVRGQPYVLPGGACFALRDNRIRRASYFNPQQ